MKRSIIQQELRRIAEENNGLLLPEQVVEAAKPASSPLHDQFEWSNTEAARLYRLHQARNLIRVMVTVIEGKATSTFISLTTDRQNDGGGYRLTSTVLSSAEMRSQLLADAMEELQVFTHKYRRLKELAGIFAAIRKLRKKL